MENKEMTKELQIIQPTSMTELMTLAETLATSDFVPVSMQGKAQDVAGAIMFGMEVGLKPMQALQNIAVIKGRPSIYGDGMLAIVMGSNVFGSIKETFNDSTMTATCTAIRKDGSTNTQTFSQVDAEQAGLWAKTSKEGKNMPWSAYPKRMLKFRARGFCLRDTFPDILSGIISTEEAQDYPEPEQKVVAEVVNEKTPIDEQILDCKTISELMAIHEKLSKEDKTLYAGNFSNQKEIIQNG